MERRSLPPGEVHLWRIDGAEEPVGTSSLSAEERERAGRFHFERDRARFLHRWSRVRELLGAYLGCGPDRVVFRRGTHGKPEVVGGGDLRFNLSHSGDLALLGVTSGADLGVDVEALRPIPDRESLAVEVFSEAELAEYRALSEEDRLVGFYQGWTRKEAWLKGRGDGLIGDLAGFDVSLAPGAAPRLLRVGDSPAEREEWVLESWTGSAFVAAAAGRRRAARIVHQE
jgi:4'-phosphopantetheinyl transferase